MVPVKEPTGPKDIEDIENRKLTVNFFVLNFLPQEVILYLQLLAFIPPSSLCLHDVFPPPVFSLPNKKVKLTPPSPPAPGPTCPPSKEVEEGNSPSGFEVLNVFRQQWFLNRVHLITNILSAQKDESRHLMWVEAGVTLR